MRNTNQSYSGRKQLRKDSKVRPEDGGSPPNQQKEISSKPVLSRLGTEEAGNVKEF